MLFRQFHLEALGHASYLVGDQATGQALVLDPRRDVAVYLDAARTQGLRITHALDSHGHNDYQAFPKSPRAPAPTCWVRPTARSATATVRCGTVR